MIKNTFSACLGLVLFQSLAFGQPIVCPIDAQQNSITFTGSSTFHDFKGQAAKVMGSIFLDSSYPIVHGEVKVDVRSLKTGEERRDKSMYEMFDSENFPVVDFRIKEADFSPTGRPAPIKGVLSMHGIALPVTILARISAGKGGYVCQGSFPVSLKKFKLRPPNILGFIRVADEVQVQFKVVFRRRI